MTKSHMIAKTRLGAPFVFRSVLILVFGIAFILHRMRVVSIHLLLYIAICAYRTMLSWLLLLSISMTGTVIIGTWSPRWTSPSRRSLALALPIVRPVSTTSFLSLSYEYTANGDFKTVRIVGTPSVPQQTKTYSVGFKEYVSQLRIGIIGTPTYLSYGYDSTTSTSIYACSFGRLSQWVHHQSRSSRGSEPGSCHGYHHWFV